MSRGFSGFCCQGPRGLPGERGRPGAPGPAVSTPGPVGDAWALTEVPDESWVARAQRT